MIRQKELWSIVDEQRAVAALEETPVIREYLQRKRLLAEKQAHIRKCVVLGEEIQKGKVRVEVKRVLAVAHEKLWAMIRVLPAVAAGISEEAEAQLLLQMAAQRDPKAPFVSERVSIEIVAD